MASSIQLLRSTIAQERPFPGNLLEGQPAVNLNSAEPGLFFKVADGSLVKFGPVAITSDGSPPNSSPQGSAGNTAGELWLDKSTDPAVLKVYDGANWIDAGSGGGGGTSSFVRWIYTAIGGETSLSGSSGGVLLNYTPGLEEVFINGVLITRGVDYSATNGSSITNITPLTVGDVVTVTSINPLEVVQLPGLSADQVSFVQNGAGAVEQTVSSRLKTIVNVIDFGADPSGVADSAPAILAAFQHIESVGGGCIEFPNVGDSTYTASHGFRIPSNCVIKLNGCKLRTTTGWNSDAPEPPPGGTYRSFFSISGSLDFGVPLSADVENVAVIGDGAIIDLRYDEQIGTRKGSSGIAIITTPAPIESNLWKVHDIIVKDVTVENALGYAFYVEGAKDVLYQNCKAFRPWNLGFAGICGWNVSFISCHASYARNGAGNQGVGFWNEANQDWQAIRNFRYYNCVSEYNNRSGYRYYNDGKDVEVSILAFGNISRFNQFDPISNTQYSSPGDAGQVVVQKSLSATSDHLIKLVGCIAEEEYGCGFKLVRISGGTDRQNFFLENCVAFNCNKQGITSNARSPFHVFGDSDSNIYLDNPLVVAPAANVDGYGIALQSSKSVFVTAPKFVGSFAQELLTSFTSGLSRKESGWDVAWDDSSGPVGDSTRFYKPVRLASFDQTLEPSISNDLYINELAVWQDDNDQFSAIYRRDDSASPKYIDFQSKKRLRGEISFAGATISHGTQLEYTITVTGAELGNIVQASFTGDLNSCFVFGYVKTANTVVLCISNNSGSSKTVATGSIVANVFAQNF